MPGLVLFVQKHRDQKRNQQGGDFAGALDEYLDECPCHVFLLARQRIVERLAAGLVDGVGESAVGDFQKAPGDEDRGDDEEE